VLENGKKKVGAATNALQAAQNRLKRKKKMRKEKRIEGVTP